MDGNFDLQKSEYLEEKPSEQQWSLQTLHKQEIEDDECIDIDDIQPGQVLVDMDDLKKKQREEEDEMLANMIME